MFSFLGLLFLFVSVLFLRYHFLSCLILMEMGILLCVWMLFSSSSLMSFWVVLILVVGVVESCVGLSLLVYSSRFCSSKSEKF